MNIIKCPVWISVVGKSLLLIKGMLRARGQNLNYDHIDTSHSHITHQRKKNLQSSLVIYY